MTAARRAALIFAGMLAWSTVSAAARAQSGTALTLFNEGRLLASQGHYEEACDRFARSNALERKVGTLINLGACDVQLNKLASAWVAYSEAEALARSLGGSEAWRAEAAHKAAEPLEPRVPRLVIAIDASYPGLVVRRNDTKVEPPEYNTAIPVDPGPQTIVVTATGRSAWQTNVRLGEGEKQTIHVPALEPAPPGAEGPGGPGAPIGPPEPGISRNGLALGLEIGGGVVLAGGLVFGAFALSTWSSVTTACPNAKCPNEASRAQHAQDVKTASTFGAVSTVGVVVGGAALATGIVLHFTAPAAKASVAVAPSFDRTGGGLLATLRL